MRRLSLAAKRCVECGRRIGLRRRPVETAEREALHPACLPAFVARDSGSVADALAEWEAIVEAVEAGGPVPTDDLTLALAARDFLEAARSELSRMWTDELGRLDERYRAATRPDRDRVMVTLWRHGPGWWWLRLPARGEAGAYFDNYAEEVRRTAARRLS
jgi:hypothetical protein